MTLTTTKKNLLHIIGVLLLIICSTQVKAQDKDYITLSLSLITDNQPVTTTTTQGESKEYLVTNEDEVILSSKGPDENIPSYFRSHKDLPKKFSGYAIELIRSKSPLAINNKLFERFGSVNVHQLENEEYSYCIILTNFRYHERVKKFAEEVVLPHVPDAQVFKYRNGKRKKK